MNQFEEHLGMILNSNKKSPLGWGRDLRGHP